MSYRCKKSCFYRVYLCLCSLATFEAPVIRLHRMQIIRPIILGVCQSAWLRCANTAERIEILLGRRLVGSQGTLYWTGVPVSPADSMRPWPNHFGYLLVDDLFTVCCYGVVSAVYASTQYAHKYTECLPVRAVNCCWPC